MPTENEFEILCGCTNLKMTARVIGRIYDEALAPTALNSTQYAILANIDRRGEVSQADLADILNMDRTTLYRAVAVLQRRNLIVSTTSGKGRNLNLKVSDEGTTLLSQARPLWLEAQTAFTESLGAANWTDLLSLLKKAQSVGRNL